MKKYFSLIELLVVIAVIGILTSLIIPALSKVRSSARTADCLSEMRQYGIANFMYLNDNKYKFSKIFYGANQYFNTGNVAINGAAPLNTQVILDSLYTNNLGLYMCAESNEKDDESFTGDHAFNTEIIEMMEHSHLKGLTIKISSQN